MPGVTGVERTTPLTPSCRANVGRSLESWPICPITTRIRRWSSCITERVSSDECGDRRRS
jgi:hypothetical protein